MLFKKYKKEIKELKEELSETKDKLLDIKINNKIENCKNVMVGNTLLNIFKLIRMLLNEQIKNENGEESNYKKFNTKLQAYNYFNKIINFAINYYNSNNKINISFDILSDLFDDVILNLKRITIDNDCMIFTDTIIVNEQTVNNLGRRTIDIDNASYVIIIDRNKKKTLYIDNYKINNLVISEILDRVCRIESYYKYINI